MGRKKAPAAERYGVANHGFIGLEFSRGPTTGRRAAPRSGAFAGSVPAYPAPMDSNPTLPLAKVRAAPTARANPARFLHLGFAILLFGLMFLGFRQFYLHGRTVSGQELPPPVSTLLIVHGVAMTTWMALSVVQPLLIVGHNRRLHMSLGIFGAGLAACIVVLGTWTAIATTHHIHTDLVRYGLHRRQFMAVPLSDIVAFALFVSVGIWQRRTPKIHRPMMLLATLAIMAAATNRIPEFRGLGGSNIWGHWFGPHLVPLAVGVLFLAAKTALTRSLDRWFAGGLVACALINALGMRIASTAVWERIATALTS